MHLGATFEIVGNMRFEWQLHLRFGPHSKGDSIVHYQSIQASDECFESLRLTVVFGTGQSYVYFCGIFHVKAPVFVKYWACNMKFPLKE